MVLVLVSTSSPRLILLRTIHSFPPLLGVNYSKTSTRGDKRGHLTWDTAVSNSIYHSSIINYTELTTHTPLHLYIGTVNTT
jgi:hypothetical protein